MDAAESEESNPLGAELRAQRKARGWTQVELGEKIRFSDSFISDVENGNKTPRSDFAAKCDEAFNLPGTFARLHGVVRFAAYPSFYQAAVPYEASAVRIHGWYLGSVPGLVQTEEYARALISATRPQDTTAQIDRLVSGRMQRQEILTGETPPKCWFVLDESVLLRVAGSREIMNAQVDALTGWARTPGIVIQVLPLEATEHPGTDGPIVAFDFEDRPTVVYNEGQRSGRIVEDAAEVAELMTTISAVRASALSPRATIDYLRNLGR